MALSKHPICLKDCKPTPGMSFKEWVETTKLTLDQIDGIEEMTLGQKDNLLWHKGRPGRITASKCSSVIRAKKLSVKKNLAKELVNPQPKTTTIAMRWGIDHENDALEQYAMEFEIPSLQSAGLILHNPTGALGCSPDSIATDPKTGKDKS
jgi:hypothetical protein